MLKAHLDILGIDKSANKDQVTKAYRERSRQYHPDKGGSKELMGLLNEARDSMLKHLANNQSEVDTTDGEIDIEKILASKIVEDFDDANGRISRKYANLHAGILHTYRADPKIEQHIAFNYFSEFVTDLYHEYEIEEDELNVIEHADLFNLIRTRETDGKICEEEITSPLPLSVQLAIEYFQKFIEGKYWGEKLINVQRMFKDQLKSVSTVAEYNLYSGILEVITLKDIQPGYESQLMLSINKITDYIRANTANTATPMPYYLASLLQNLYFRTLVSQALHLFWREHGLNFDGNSRADLINLNVTRQYLKNLSGQLIARAKEENLDDDLIYSTAGLKRLYQFEELFSKSVNETNSPEWYRQRGFDTLDWLNRLMRFMDRKVLANVFIQAGTYFQEASICANQFDQTVAKADQKLALQAYMEAYILANHSAPDLEIYTLINILKFIAAFKYADNDLKDIVKAFQSRLLNLMNIYPVFSGLQSNINLLIGEGSNLSIMRGLLHALVDMLKAGVSVDHANVTVLYQAYEACVKSWYKQNYDPELENQFRTELMRVLLENSNWNFSNLDRYLVAASTINRDEQGWFETAKPLRIVTLKYKTYSTFEGVEVDKKSGQINFMMSEGYKGDKNWISSNTFAIHDLVEMLQKNIMGASFSLDPVDPNMMYHPFNTMRFMPHDIYQTQFLHTMLLADYILKFLTIGMEVQGKLPYDMRPIAEMVKHLPKHLQEIISNFHASQKHNSGAIHRFWIEAEQISEALVEYQVEGDEDGEDRKKLALTNLKMVVKKHTMERDVNGNLVDTQKDDEGWDLYILSQAKLNDINSGSITIKGPAMLFVPESKSVTFIETDRIFKETQISDYHAQQLKTIESYGRDNEGKVIVTIDNSIFIYRFASDIAELNEVPTHYSPEYVFAQEFTAHYDEFSQYFLILARLKELSKITSAIRFLNQVKAEAIATREYYLRLNDCIPEWEDRYDHPSYDDSNYFAEPSADAEIDEEERAQRLFRHKHADKIDDMLPETLCMNHSHNLRTIAEQIRNLKVDIDSPEVEEACVEKLEMNKEKFTEERGEEWWRKHEQSMWKQICAKKSVIMQQVNSKREKEMREQLQSIFSSILDDLPEHKVNRLVNKAMKQDFEGCAEDLAELEFKAIKRRHKHLILDQERILATLKRIGLASQVNDEVNLEDKCLWVPASVRHHVAGNNTLFIYGGVRVVPRVNVIPNTSPAYWQTINNAFNPQTRVAVTSNAIIEQNRVVAQQISNNSSRTNSSNGGNAYGGGLGRNNNGSSGGNSEDNRVQSERTINDPLRRTKHGHNEVDPEFKGKSHTQLGTERSKERGESYFQAREFDADGNTVKDIHFTDHGRRDHPNPHQHRYTPNETGGTLRRGGPEPLNNEFQPKGKI